MDPSFTCTPDAEAPGPVAHPYPPSCTSVEPPGTQFDPEQSPVFFADNQASFEPAGLSALYKDCPQTLHPAEYCVLSLSRRNERETVMPSSDAVVPLADVFLYIPEGKPPASLLNQAIRICAGRSADVSIRA